MPRRASSNRATRDDDGGRKGSQPTDGKSQRRCFCRTSVLLIAAAALVLRNYVCCRRGSGTDSGSAERGENNITPAQAVLGTIISRFYINIMPMMDDGY